MRFLLQTGAISFYRVNVELIIFQNFFDRFFGLLLQNIAFGPVYW